MSDNIAEPILQRRAPGLPPFDLADVLDSLVWLLRDNGAEIDDARRRWIDGDDSFAAEVAIQMNEGIPCKPEEMIRRLDELRARFPQLSKQCEELRGQVLDYLSR